MHLQGRICQFFPRKEMRIRISYIINVVVVGMFLDPIRLNIIIIVIPIPVPISSTVALFSSSSLRYGADTQAVRNVP